MKDCCKRESRRSLKRHRDVAVCDDCSRLLLGYDVEDDYTKTLATLDDSGAVYETRRDEKTGLWVIAKERAAGAAPSPSGSKRHARGRSRTRSRRLPRHGRGRPPKKR